MKNVTSVSNTDSVQNISLKYYNEFTKIFFMKVLNCVGKTLQMFTTTWTHSFSGHMVASHSFLPSMLDMARWPILAKEIWVTSGTVGMSHLKADGWFSNVSFVAPIIAFTLNSGGFVILVLDSEWAYPYYYFRAY